MQSSLLTVPEAAIVLKVSTRRLYGLLRQNLVPSVRIGRQRRICPKALDEFVRNGGKAWSGGWRRLPQH
jgi:excisionase family DNA binding protein